MKNFESKNNNLRAEISTPRHRDEEVPRRAGHVSKRFVFHGIRKEEIFPCIHVRIYSMVSRFRSKDERSKERASG